ncbi:MAG: SAM-dependent chlorinase/fluorinase [Zestosphaera sp.]
MRRLIAVLTDYGLKDHYAGHLRAVIKKVCPEAEVVDITHSIPKYNITLGAHVLKISRKYFPKGTVFLAVVDPEVGGARRNLLLKTRDYMYVGPDNGILLPAALGDELEAYEILIDKVRLFEVTPTFHGRDVYAPAAAMVACGVRPDSIGSPTPRDTLKQPPLNLSWVEPVKEGLRAKVVHVDDFGNVVTSACGKDLEEALNLRLGDEVIFTMDGREWHGARYVDTFSRVKAGEFAIYEGSYELVEIAKYMGSAADELRGAEVIFRNPALRQPA